MHGFPTSLPLTESQRNYSTDYFHVRGNNNELRQFVEA